MWERTALFYKEDAMAEPKLIDHAIPGIYRMTLTGPNLNRTFTAVPENGFGFLGRLPHPGRVRIELELEELYPIYAFVVDAQKNPTHLHEDKDMSERRHVFKGMSINKDEAGVSYVGYPANHLRLGEITESLIRIWELSIVSQYGEFFFTSQRTFHVKVERKLGGKLFLQQNRLKTWPQMMEFLEKILGEPLFPIGEDSETKKDVPVETVIWWNIAQGVGAIQSTKGAARAHWSQVAVKSRKFRYLIEGERVQCEVTPVILKEGVRPTMFKWEAKNITPLT